MAIAEKTLSSIEQLVLAIRHPADEIRISAEVAYWNASREYHLRKIVQEFDRLAPLVEQLRAHVYPKSEAA